MIDLIILSALFLFIYLIQQRRGELKGANSPFFLSICSGRGVGGQVFSRISAYIQQNIQECCKNGALQGVYLHILGDIQAYLGVYLRIFIYFRVFSLLPCPKFSSPLSLRSFGSEQSPLLRRGYECWLAFARMMYMSPFGTLLESVFVGHRVQ